MKIDQLPQDMLENLLNATDEFAVANVKADRGGPFGASIHVYNQDTGGLTLIGDIEANAVLSFGMGSAHAEDQAMKPSNVAALKEHLMTQGNSTDNIVIFSSSGESCPACHSKEEILARTLVEECLIAPGNFVVTYGATFKDTAEVAGFNDEPYHKDMQEPLGTGMIFIKEQKINDIPDKIFGLFLTSPKAAAAVVLPNKKIILGFEDRENDLMATAEVSAIRNACKYQKEQGVETPWDLGGATLYTSTKEIGPLVYAECQWANITNYVAVNHSRAKEMATQEAPDISNAEFFKLIASPDYNRPGSAIEVKNFKNFANKAQWAWREKLAAAEDASKILYNGIKTEDNSKLLGPN